MIQTISADDRVLLLALADTSRLRVWARAHMLVGLGSDDEVRVARRQFADLDNVMFVVGDRTAIPWQQHFFTVIVDADGGEPTPAMLRCLTENGRIVAGE